jgi:hypothetical protein
MPSNDGWEIIAIEASRGRPPNCTAQREDKLLTIPTFGLALMTMASLGVCPGKDLSSPADASPPGPIHNVAEEAGVVSAGSSLVVQTDGLVTAFSAILATIYTANVMEDVVDQNGTVLIPKGSPVELGVRSLPYFGPGGVGMIQLILELRAVTAKGVCYPVATASENPGAGGLGLDELNSPKWVGGRAPKGEVLTSDPRINVPAKTLLAFQIVEPIRLTGLRR